MILGLASRCSRVFTLEENVLQGGFGAAVLELLEQHDLMNIELHRLGYPETPIQQGEQQELRAILGLDAAGIVKTVLGVVASNQV
jgi:1-deoxy-D-xylulose-5-phosphate synthase